MQVDGAMIDGFMVFFALVYNACITMIFLARAVERYRLEMYVGYVVTLLLLPFAILMGLNLSGGRESGLLITGTPIIIFLAYDLWYRTLRGRKPIHHPEGRWPVELYAYLVIYLIASILLVGYAFLVSLTKGFAVLATFYMSLAAYGYYQYRHRKGSKSVAVAR